MVSEAKGKSFFKNLLQRKEERGLLGFEAATLVYIIITGVIIMFEWGELSSPFSMVVARCIFVACILAGIAVHHHFPCKASVMLRVAICFLGLIYWYPETYSFCSIFPYQDHVFANIDYSVFGFQPSLEFSNYLNSTFWYELFSLGYYSYYYLMIAMVLFYFIARYDDFQRASFVFLFSFFLFYLVFDFLPVAGPQYYYCANGVEMGSLDQFPEMGDYFKTHTDILPMDVRGFFSQQVLNIQEHGENPTAAFPSSHVGMAMVTMLLSWQARNRWLFWILLLFSVVLFFATVYLKAHYVVDSVSGLFFGYLFFKISELIFPWFSRTFHLKP